MTVPAYLRIRQYITDLVYQNPGREQKILSERELGKAFNVTRTTARKALRELIEGDYLIVRHGIGNFTNPKMASGDASSHMFSIGIVVYEGQGVTFDSYLWEIVSGIGEHFSNKGYCFRFISLPTDSKRALKELSLMNVDGLIWIKPPSSVEGLIKEIRKQGIPLVAAIPLFDSDKLDQVRINFFEEGYDVANYMLDRKHRRVVYVKYESEADTRRFAGFVKAFTDRGFKYDQKLSLPPNSDVCTDVQRMIDFGVDFSAIYVPAIQINKVLEALKSRKKSPRKDYLVIGFRAAMGHLKGSGAKMVNEPLLRIGQNAAELLDRILCAGLGSTPKNIELKTDIIDN